MKLAMRVRASNKKVTLITAAFVLALSTLTASLPFVLSQNANAATTVNSTADLKAAISGSDIEIILGSDFSVTEQINIGRTLTLNGNGKKLTAALTGVVNGSNDSVLAVSQPVTINNLVVDGAGIAGVQGIQIYKTSATLSNVTVKNNKKAGLNVNGSNVTVNNITTANNGTNYGGIHLSKGSGVATMPTVTINGQSQHNESYAIFTDVAGTVNDVNGQYTASLLVPFLTNYVVYNLKDAPLAPVITAPTTGALFTSSTVALQWTGAAYATTYDIKLDGTESYGHTGTSFNMTGLTEGAHSVQIRSVAKSGLVGEWSSAVTFNVDLNDVPKVTLTTPVAGSAVSTKVNGNKLQLKGTFTDDEAVNYLQFELVYAGNLVTVGTMHYFTVNPDGTYTYDLPVASNLASGEYSLFFTGTDFENGVTVRNQRVFTIDNTKPTVQLLSPITAGPFKTAGATISVKATDNAGLNKIVANIYKDGNLFKSTQVLANGAVEQTHTVDLATVISGGLASGNYSVKYNALDIAGNISSTGQFAFVIDNDGPVTPQNLKWTTSNGGVIDDGGITNEVNGTASWDASTSSDVSHYLYRYWNGIAGNPYKEASPYPASTSSTSLSGAFNQGEGVHYFSVAAVDHLGNVSVWSNPFQVTLDETDPFVEISSYTRTFVRGTADADAKVTVAIDGTESAPITPDTDGSWSYVISPVLAVGTHSIVASATDNANNESATDPETLIVSAPNLAVTPTITTFSADSQQNDDTTADDPAATPAFIGPLAFADILGTSTTDDTDSDDSAGTPEVKGTSITDTLAAAVDADNTNGSALGLAWYWWLLILAALSAIIWGIVSALRNREQV